MENQLTKKQLLQETKRVFCRRCGRELKSKNAKELGFGPSCYKKYIKELNVSTRKKLFTIDKET